jgi:hypothetical protein
LDASTAVLNGEVDVLSEISGSDDIYAHTQGTDTIAVTFPFSSLTDDARSFVFVSEGYYMPLAGNTFYVDTWDGSSWIERMTLYEPNEEWDAINDVNVKADLSLYLPDPCGEYKVKIRNSMSAAWNEAYVDCALLNVGGHDFSFTYAKESDITDILSLVEASDDVKWSAVNEWAIFKFLCEYPACWDFETQCNGDTDGDGDVDTTDWPNFRDSFAKNINDHPEDYEPCADFDRDGDVDTTDWPQFRDNFAQVPAADCEPGDPCEIYCPAG